jgi:hypothetical protein
MLPNHYIDDDDTKQGTGTLSVIHRFLYGCFVVVWSEIMSAVSDSATGSTSSDGESCILAAVTTNWQLIANSTLFL